jgi:hypothetical protein
VKIALLFSFPELGFQTIEIPLAGAPLLPAHCATGLSIAVQ